MRTRRSIGTRVAGLVLAAAAVGAIPRAANAWVVWGGGVRIGIPLPGVVIAPPVYAPPPVYYAPPLYAPPVYAAPPRVVYAPPPPAYYNPRRPVWVPPHYRGPYLVPGHWS